MSEDRTHNPRGPSGLKRIMNCSAAAALISQCPPSKSGPDALKGTAVHWVIEQLMRSEQKKGAYVYYGNRSITLEGKEIKITPEMVDNAEFCVRYIKEQLALYDVPISELGIEDKVVFIRKSETDLNEDIDGSLDYGFVVPYQGIVTIDYKNGYHKVSALGNEQLLAYALGKYNQLSEFMKAEIQWIKIVIVQQQTVEEWTCDVEFLLNFRQLVIKAFNASIVTPERSAEFKTGEWCKWCPAQFNGCPAYDQLEIRQLQESFKDLPIVEQAKTLPAPSQITPQNAYALLRSEKTMDTFFKQLKQYALGVLENGTEEQKAEYRAAGFTLKESLGDREYVDPDAALVAVGNFVVERLKVTNQGKPINLDLDTLQTEPEILSPAQMEKHLKKEYNISEKQFAELGLTKRENKGYMLKYD